MRERVARLRELATRDRLSPGDAVYEQLPFDADRQWISCRTLLGPAPEAAAVAAAVERQLAVFPRMHQRLVPVPFGVSRAVWADDPAFDAHRHVHAVALPAPGDDAALARLIGKAFSAPVDPGRPPWEIMLVAGLEGDRCAIVTRVHHAASDGMLGRSFVIAVLDQPEDAAPPPPPPPPRVAPGAVRLVGEGLLERATRPGLRARLARRRGSSPERPEPAWAGGAGAPITPFDGPVGPDRHVGWFDGEVGAYRALAKAHGVTVNDIVITVVAGALRAELQRHGQAVDGVEPRAFVPVSLRAGPDLQPGNRTTSMIAPLPVHLPDPVARLRRVHKATSEFKREPSRPRDPGYNMVVANIGSREIGVPGGRPVESSRSFAPLLGPHALSFVAASSGPTLVLSVTTDAARVPDAAGVAGRLRDAFSELAATAPAAVS